MGREPFGEERAVRRLDTTICCSDEAARNRPATYKLAAEWSGGGYTELKTYGFADDECLERVYFAAKRRSEKIDLTEGEKLGELRVFRLEKNRHDYELERLVELEESLRSRYEKAHATGTQADKG